LPKTKSALRPIGVIGVGRAEPGPFANKQVELLQTFADQAVITIENTRLFEAKQASKRELEESPEYQTATSAVLNVISRSKRDVQPVIDAIVKSAATPVLRPSQRAKAAKLSGRLAPLGTM